MNKKLEIALLYTDNTIITKPDETGFVRIINMLDHPEDDEKLFVSAGSFDIDDIDEWYDDDVKDTFDTKNIDVKKELGLGFMISDIVVYYGMAEFCDGYGEVYHTINKDDLDDFIENNL